MISESDLRTYSLMLLKLGQNLASITPPSIISSHSSQVTPSTKCHSKWRRPSIVNPLGHSPAQLIEWHFMNRCLEVGRGLLRNSSSSPQEYP